MSATVGALLLVSGAAAACDDFDEEMAVQVARSAVKLEQARTDAGQDATVAAASLPAPSQWAEVAAVEPYAAPTSTSAPAPSQQAEAAAVEPQAAPASTTSAGMPQQQ
jgi:hypothetical protein